MKTTNYTSTFIQVADDCPIQSATPPPTGRTAATIAELQFELISENPSKFSSDDVLFQVHAIRKAIPEEDPAAAREEFFTKSRIALIPLGSAEYQALADDTSLKQLKAMRSKRVSG